jgi:hypothetical protein
VICDQRIMFNGFYSAKNYPEHLRRVRFKDPESGKTLVFLTNNTSLPALTIAAPYKSRWQVELFSKWIKQHLRIKRFLGTSENAAKTQVWCAIATYVLIAIVKKELHLDASLYTCLQSRPCKIHLHPVAKLGVTRPRRHTSRRSAGPVASEGIRSMRPMHAAYNASREKTKTRAASPLVAMARSSHRMLNPAAHSTACSASPLLPLSQQRSMRLSLLV